MKKIACLLVLGMSLSAESTTFLLIRHGETDWNKHRRVQGQVDIPLNEVGKQQAKDIAEHLEERHADILAVYSSDLVRAADTAEETAKIFGLAVEKRESLREAGSKTTDGMHVVDKIAKYSEAWKEIVARYPDKKERWKHSAIEGEETFRSIADRIRQELVQIATSHPDEKVAVFSHSKSILIFLADVQDQDWPNDLHFPNCGVAEVTYDLEGETFELTNIESLL